MRPLKELITILKGVLTHSIENSFYRFIGIQYLKDPLSCLGSKITGGRYNFKNKFDVLYLAPDPTTAIKESLRDTNFRWPPKALITIEVKAQIIIDLEDETIIKTMGIDKNKLLSPWRKVQDIEGKEAYTQVLGRIIYESDRFEGIRYPSVRSEGRYNLAIFPRKLREKSQIMVYDPDRLLEQIIQGHHK